MTAIRSVARGDALIASVARRLIGRFTESTVKTHVRRVLGKLELRDRVQAVVLAYDT